MTFSKNEYLSWYMPKVHDHELVNLHSSGVAALSFEHYQPTIGDPWTMPKQFEVGLAHWLGIKPEELIFTPGATGGTLLACMTLVDPGKEILVESPIYEPMRLQAERLGPVNRFVRRLEDGWALRLDQIEKKINESTALVMITEPTNPGGVLESRQRIIALAKAAHKVGAKVLVNEVYRGFTDAPSFFGEADNIVVVSSLSKLMGTYWARLGWISADPQTIKKLRIAHLNFGMATSPAAGVGLSILKKADELRQNAIDLAGSKLEIVKDWVNSTGQNWTTPTGPGFACVTLPKHLQDDIAFCEKLLTQKGVLAIPGTFFEVPGTIRIGWLQTGQRLEEGLGKISQLLK